MAKHQTQGRGQRGTSWLAKPTQNLTASFCYAPQQLPVNDQFLAAVHCSLAVYDVVKELSMGDVSIKWPNDILIGKKKIAGILIETKISGQHIKSVIAGIGLNVQQSDFPEEIAYKTTSIHIENPQSDLTILDIVKKIQHRLQHYQDIFQQENSAAYLALYNSRLFRKDIISDFIVDSQPIKGQIKGVEKDGHLIVSHQNETKKYDLKSIIYKL